MNPVNHAIASGAISASFYMYTQSLSGSVVCFLSGIFIDIDHFLDFFLARKRITFKYKELFSYCACEKEGPIHLIFHSYELHLLIWLTVYFLNLNYIWIGFALGASTHLILDQFTNPTRPLVYFLLYRMKHRFQKEYIFTSEYYKTLL